MNATRRLFSIVIATAALAIAGGCSQSGDNKKAAGPPTAPVKVTTVAQRDVPVQVTSIGNVEAYSAVQLKSQVAGPVLAVHFNEGQDVEKGQLLVTIDPQPFEADVHRAEATLAKDQAQLANAKSQAARWQQLLKEGVVAREQADQISTNAQALEATVKADQALLESSRLQLQYTKIYAPISGRTGNLMIKAGNLVKANDTPALVTINQVTPIYVNFAVPEQYLGAIKQYMKEGKLTVKASVPNQAGTTEGILTFVDNAVDQATGSIKLKATFNNQDRTLWPGQFVNAVVTLTTQRNATVIPVQAILNGQQGPYVFIVKDGGTTENRPIVLERTLGETAVIKDGVQVGETVVTDGQSRIVAGGKVSIQNAGANDKAGAPGSKPEKARGSGRNLNQNRSADSGARSGSKQETAQ